MFNRINGYFEQINENKYLTLVSANESEEKIKNHEELCNEFGKKNKNTVKKEFDSEPVYNEKYLEVKIKPCNGKINIDFHNNKIPKEGSQFICLSAILIHSVFKTGKNYYLQVFLEECKYVVKKKKIPKYIIDEIEIFSDSDRENSDEENSDEKNFHEENSDEKNLKIVI